MHIMTPFDHSIRLQTAELGTFRRDLGCGNTIKLNSGAQNGCSGAEFQIPTSFGCGLGAGKRPAGGGNQSDNTIYTQFSRECCSAKYLMKVPVICKLSFGGFSSVIQTCSFMAEWQMIFILNLGILTVSL